MKTKFKVKLGLSLLLLLLSWGIINQIGFHQADNRYKTSIGSKNPENFLNPLSAIDLKLQWSFNSNAYTSLSSQVELDYYSTNNITNLHNCTVNPEATIGALGQFSDGNEVDIIATSGSSEFYADCYLNFSDPIGFLSFNITQIDIIVFVGINTSLQRSQIQLYNRTGDLFDRNVSIETTSQNRTISILSNFQHYLGGSNNLTIRFYGNDTSPIQANITIDGIVAHVYYDVKIPDILWSIAVGDGNGDNEPELAIAGENGSLLCINGTDGSFLWSCYLTGPTFSVGFADINADDNDEVIATRVSGFFPKYHNVTVFDFNTQALVGGYEFQGLPAYSIIGVGGGDVRNNTKEEVLFVNNLGDLYVFDGETNERLEKTSPLGDMVVFGGGSNKGFDINFGDIDRDSVSEFIVSGIDDGGAKGSAVLNRWENDEISKVWEFNLNTSAYCSIANFGDIDGDGKAEVVVGERANDLVAGGEVYLLNGETSDILWQFDTGTTNVYDISCGDILNDGRDEIAIAVGGNLNQTFILEGENNSILWQIPSPYEINGVELYDVNNDGKCEVITIGNEIVNLYCFDTDGDGTTDIDDFDDDADNLTDTQEVTLYNTNPFLLDSDYDNLSDTAELFAHGTNANWWDTDNDSLGDWMELNVHHTDPLDSNSDDDYLADGEEILLGLDPNDPDSDDDGYMDGQVKPDGSQFDWLFYFLIAIVIVTAFILAINLRYFFRYKRLELPQIKTKKKAENLRKVIKDAVWFWGHGAHVLKNFDKLINKNNQIITLEALTRTWTQHYKKTFKKVFKLSEEEASERAETQKKKEIFELYNLLKDKIEIKIVPIKFGKYAGSNSYQFEIWGEEPKMIQKSEKKISEENNTNDEK